MSSAMPFERWNSAPKPSGLYNAAHDRDACGLAMVATLRGTPGHDIVEKALEALRNLEHRGAVGSDEGTGDGAGIVTQIPDTFFRSVLDFELPAKGSFAAGTAFLPLDSAAREKEKLGIEAVVASEGLVTLGWRDVPVHPEILATWPEMRCPFLRRFFFPDPKATSSRELILTG